MNFQRSITTIGLLFAGISSVIGSGWLFGPLYAAQIAGPAAALSWVLGALLMILIALTFAELGTAFPVAGGMIQFAQFSHGPMVSFMIGWMVWVSSLAVAPVETLGLIQYASNYFPALMHSTTTNGAHTLTTLGTLASAFVMLIMCTLNHYGAQFFSKSNTFITSIKLIVPIATVCILLIADFHISNFTATPAHGTQSGFGFFAFGWHGIFAALPLGGVIYSFIGSNTVLQLAGETKNPQRSIPLALIGSMIFCMVLYTLLQITFIGALSPNMFANGWANLQFPGDNGPFSGIMMLLGFSWFVIIIYADAIISPFGTGYVFTASTARVTYGLSEIGFLPSPLKKLSKRGVPARCIALNFIIGLMLFLPFPGWQKLVSFIISCFIISYIIGPLSLVALRHTQANTHRPFKLPCANLIALIAFYVCNLLIFWTGWTTVSKMMVALSIGLLYFFIRSIKHSDFRDHWRRAWWMIPYFIALAIISYLGSFGNGKNIISFGPDFLVIGILSVIVFYITVVSAKQVAKSES